MKYQVNIDKGYRGIPFGEVIEVEDGDVESSHLAEIGFLTPIEIEKPKTGAFAKPGKLDDLLTGAKSIGGE
jgi:hypothetical protein